MYIGALVWGVHEGSWVMQFNGWVTQVLLLDNLWRQRCVTQRSSFKRSLETGKIGEWEEGKISSWEPWLCWCEIIFLNQTCKWFLKIIAPTQPSLQNWLYPPPSYKKPHLLLSPLPISPVLSSTCTCTCRKRQGWPAHVIAEGFLWLSELCGWEYNFSHWKESKGDVKLFMEVAPSDMFIS